MDFKRLANTIRRFSNINIDLLINSVELLEDNKHGVKSIDDLTNYLEDELRYFEN